MDSTVAGDSPMAVPVGNTVATNDRTPAPPGPPPQPYAGGGAPTFTPVPDAYIAVPARVIHEVNSADIYPPVAARMGVEGHVDLRVGIDENGDVKEVKVIRVRPPGYKFDEAAAQAMRQFKFAPARASDGKAVVSRITYSYSFTPAQ
jgi:TonB family protein